MTSSQFVDLVEDLADDMEERSEVRPADAEIQPHCLADLGVQRMQRGQRAHRAVEDEILGTFRQQLLDTEFLAATLAEGLIRVDLALNDVELVIHLGQTFFGFHQDEPVHAVGDVLGHHRRRAVTDVEVGHQHFEGHRLLVPGIDLQHGAAAGPGCRVKIDRVDHRALRRILRTDIDLSQLRQYALVLGLLARTSFVRAASCAPSTRTTKMPSKEVSELRP
jgi:hypothetical protein